MFSLRFKILFEPNPYYVLCPFLCVQNALGDREQDCKNREKKWQPLAGRRAWADRSLCTRRFPTAWVCFSTLVPSSNVEVRLLHNGTWTRTVPARLQRQKAGGKKEACDLQHGGAARALGSPCTWLTAPEVEFRTLADSIVQIIMKGFPPSVPLPCCDDCQVLGLHCPTVLTVSHHAG